MPLYPPTPSAATPAALPTGVIASTIPRWVVNAGGSLTSSGGLKMALIWLDAGMLVSNIVLVSGSTAGASLTHSFAGLYSPSQSAPVLLATSADDTTATWAVNTTRTYAMTTPYAVPASGFFYIGSFQAGTTIPSIYGQNAGISTALAAMLPVTGAISSTGLTTSLPNPAAALTVNATQYYAHVT